MNVRSDDSDIRDSVECVRISVIIPVWNGAGTIAKCLAALRAQSFPMELFEVIVVDNGSTDDTAKIARAFSGVRVISETRAGSYAARNTGVNAARGEYVAFTDADCVPDVDWLESAAKAAAKSDAEIFGGRIVLYSEDNRSNAGTKYEMAFSFNQRDNVRRSRCVTANWFCRRSLLLKFGGFDATLKSGGDAKLSQKISTSGGKIVYVPEMIVNHPVRADLASIIAKRQRTLGGDWQSMQTARLRFFRIFIRITRQSLGKVWKTVRAPQKSLRDKVEISCIVSRVWVGTVQELVLLALGSEPKRA